MVAHVLPFFPEFAFAAEAIRGGQFGKVLAAHFKRVIAKPDWSADIGDAAKTGGPAVDLHIHDTHFIGLVCGVPKQVFSVGTVERDAVTYLTTSYLYGPGGPAVTCSSGALSHERAAVRPRLRDVPGEGDALVRFRRYPAHAAHGGREGHATGAAGGRRPARGVRG